jgi:hypothetical protein
MRPLDPSTRTAFVQRRHVLQPFPRHEPVSLLHVRRLLLRHRIEEAIPDLADESWYRREGAGKEQGGAEALEEWETAEDGLWVSRRWEEGGAGDGEEGGEESGGGVVQRRRCHGGGGGWDKKMLFTVACA